MSGIVSIIINIIGIYASVGAGTFCFGVDLVPIVA